MRKYLVLALLGTLLIAGCVSQPQKVGLTLPADAIKLSPAVPAMGEHWAVPKDLPFGPIYLVHSGKVVGVEYMMHERELKSNPVTLPNGEVMGKTVSMSTMGQGIDHVELTYMPKGHEGDVEPHYDVHMYFISKEAQSKIA